MLRARIIVFIAQLMLVAPAIIVSRISIENGYQLEPLNDQYKLSIRHPDGSSWREETVQEIAPGELEVRGTLNQSFGDQGAALVVTYEAGRNGYVAKYSYGISKPTQGPIFPYLSPIVLKSTAG